MGRMMDLDIVNMLFSFLMFLTVDEILSYNLDYEYSVIKQGPSNSLFGFSVAVHEYTLPLDGKPKVHKWLLVGAPRANSTDKDLSLYRELINPGTVFKCSPTDASTKCNGELPFDTRRNRNKKENKNNQWFGVSLQSGGKDKAVVGCAHRYLDHGKGENKNLLLGRCRSVIEDFSFGSTYNPCKKFSDDYTVPSHKNYGQCQAGIGLDIVDNNSSDVQSFVIGGPGAMDFVGRLFQMQDDQALKKALESSKLKGYDSSLFGYSVAIGKFLSKSRKDIAAGGPRSKSAGKVLIVKRLGSVLDASFEQALILPNDGDNIQIGSGFGFAVCAIEWKGYSSLLVGAPFYASDARTPEIGIVYHYISDGKGGMRLSDHKFKGTMPRGIFGAAIVDAGDINLDTHNDIIIGAPYESDGAGAIYIFQGSLEYDGIVPKATQRILASSIDSGLRGFGRSLAAGLDMDDNSYIDVLVGAYASDSAVLLRTRPIIDLRTDANISPNKIEATRKSGAKQIFDIILRIHYVERSGVLNTNQKIILELEADPGRTPRVKFSRTDKAKISTTVTIGPKKPTKPSALIKAELIYDTDGNIALYPDITFRLLYKLASNKPKKLNGQVTSLDEYPVLHKKYGDGGKDITANLFDFKLEFDRGCNPCVPDLSVTTEKNQTIRLGWSTYNVNITLTNSGPNPAYGVNIIIGLPSGLSVSELKRSNRDSPSFSDPTNNGSRTITTIEKIFNQFDSGTSELVVLVLDTKKIDPNTKDKLITLNVTSANAENGTYADNVFELTVHYKAEADLTLRGTPVNRREFYGGVVTGESAIKYAEEIGHVVKHRYIVRNKGPDQSPSAVVTIHWPFEAVSGKHLLYLMDVETTRVNCTFKPGQINELRYLRKTASTSNNHTTSAESTRKRYRRDIGNNATNSSATPSIVPPSGETPLVKKSQLPGSVEPGQNNERKFKREGRVLDCRDNTARCTVFTCNAKDVDADNGFQITIVSRIWNSTFLTDYKGETVTIVSYATIGTNSSYIVDTNPTNNNATVFTVLRPETPTPSKERLAVWKIVLAVLAGIILLALLIFGLYKIGFFKRTRATFRKSSEVNGADETLLAKKEAAKHSTSE